MRRGKGSGVILRGHVVAGFKWLCEGGTDGWRVRVSVVLRECRVSALGITRILRAESGFRVFRP